MLPILTLARSRLEVFFIGLLTDFRRSRIVGTQSKARTRELSS